MQNLLVVIVFLLSSLSFSQNNVSIYPDPYCLGITYTSDPSSPHASVLEPGNDYGCLASSPGPTWYFLKVLDPGLIQLTLSAPADIDYILYGPFSSKNDLLSNSSSHGTSLNSLEHDCSYSSTNIETPVINAVNTGEYYLLLITNYAGHVQQINLNQTGGAGSLDCTVYNELGEHYVFGTAFYDADQNGIMNGSEIGIPNVGNDASPINTVSFSDSYGGFYFINSNLTSLDTVDYVVSSQGLPGWSFTTPASYQFTLDTLNNIDSSIYFGFFPDSVFISGDDDFNSSIISCLGVSDIWLDIQNEGTVPFVAEVTLTIDTSLNFNYSSVMSDSIVGETMFFSEINLNVLEHENIHFILYPNPGSLQIGDTVHFSYEIIIRDTNGIEIDTLMDTVFYPIACSYDPNNKTSFPNGIIGDTVIDFGDFIEYRINFENTGTAQAFNVTITDTLEVTLDPSTIEFVSSSHPSSFSLSSNNILNMEFPNINLSNINIPSTGISNKGYFKYRINHSGLVLPNEYLNNSANIFFDLNPPILTLTAVNQLNCFIMPQVPNIIVGDNVISTSLSDPNYQFSWYLDGVLIIGETGSSINVTQVGNYSVKVSNQYGCTVSDSTTVGFLSVEDELDHKVKIYPNPTRAEFIIEFESAGSKTIKIHNVLGKLVFEKVTSNNKMIIQDGDLDSGIYFIEIIKENGEEFTRKLIKQ